MKRISKCKNGFTLVEMVIVVAIILILASVMTISALRFIRAGEKASESVNVSQEKVSLSIAEANQNFVNAGFV